MPVSQSKSNGRMSNGRMPYYTGPPKLRSPCVRADGVVERRFSACFGGETEGFKVLERRSKILWHRKSGLMAHRD